MCGARGPGCAEHGRCRCSRGCTRARSPTAASRNLLPRRLRSQYPRGPAWIRAGPSEASGSPSPKKRLQTTTTHQLLTPVFFQKKTESGCLRRAGSIIASLRACSLVRAVLLCGCAALVASFPSSPAPVFGQGRARAAAHFRRRALPSSGARHPESRPLNMANDEEKALFDDLTGSNTASRPPQRSPPCERPCSTCLAAQRAPS